MQINTENLVSITEANQNFSSVAKKVNATTSVVILKNNKPKYVLSEFNDATYSVSDTEIVEIVAMRILREHKYAFEVLAQ